METGVVMTRRYRCAGGRCLGSCLADTSLGTCLKIQELPVDVDFNCGISWCRIE